MYQPVHFARACCVTLVLFATALPTLAADVEAKATGLLLAVKQPNDMACWAAAATTMKSWKDSSPYGLDAVVDSFGTEYRQYLTNQDGVPPDRFDDYAQKMGVKKEPLACYTAQAIADMIAGHGPLLVVHNPTGNPKTSFLHAMVVTAIKGDGTAAGTDVTYLDPADGQEHHSTFETFITKYESAAADAVTVQLMHY